jgi:hypothetical protein
VSEAAPSSAQIVAEWSPADPASDSARWREGISLYEAGSLDDGITMETAAELMCAGLTHYVVDSTVICDLGDEPSDAAVAQTIWNVLVATLYGSGGTPLSAGSAKCLRLALAAARQGGYQAEDLGGNDLMAEVFDDASRARMSAALTASPSRAGKAPVQLARWFTDQAESKPTLAAHAGHLTGQTQPGASLRQEGETTAVSRWGALRERAQQARHYVNPIAVQHGIEAIQGALTESQIAKMDRAGKLKIRKFGLAKAAMRPSKTLRRALDGAALSEHLKAYKELGRGSIAGKDIAASGDFGGGRSMDSEQVLCRAKICDRIFMGGGFGMEHAYRKQWGEAIVTNQRLIAKWDDGRMEQFPLAHIRGIDFGEPRKQSLGDRNYTRRFKQDNPGIQRIWIELAGSRSLVEWDSVSARELVSGIQEAMMPF